MVCKLFYNTFNLMINMYFQVMVNKTPLMKATPEFLRAHYLRGLYHKNCFVLYTARLLLSANLGDFWVYFLYKWSFEILTAIHYSIKFLLFDNIWQNGDILDQCFFLCSLQTFLCSLYNVLVLYYDSITSLVID